jgi:hypothetical protein
MIGRLTLALICCIAFIAYLDITTNDEPKIDVVKVKIHDQEAIERDGR